MNYDIGQPSRRATYALEQNVLPTSHEMLHIPPSDHGSIDGSDNPVQAANPAWTERHTVKKQYLTILEAASLIVNKMIGTGIFTTPGMVLALTQSKTLALSFWIVGGLYAAIWYVHSRFAHARAYWLTYHLSQSTCVP